MERMVKEMQWEVEEMVKDPVWPLLLWLAAIGPLVLKFNTIGTSLIGTQDLQQRQEKTTSTALLEKYLYNIATLKEHKIKHDLLYM